MYTGFSSWLFPLHGSYLRHLSQLKDAPDAVDQKDQKVNMENHIRVMLGTRTKRRNYQKPGFNEP